MLSGCLMIDCLRSFCLVKSPVSWWGLAFLIALGLASMMLRYMTVKTVAFVGRTGMHRTGCSGETRLVPHVPSSSRAGKHS